MQVGQVASFHAGAPSPEALPGNSPAFDPYPSQEYNSSTCYRALGRLGGFQGNVRSALGVNASQVEVSNLKNTINMTAAGILVANLSSLKPVDVDTVSNLTVDLANQVYTDTVESGDQWAQLFSSFDFASIGQILSNISTPLDADQLRTVGGQLAGTVDLTGVGYFLGNVSNFYDQRNYGSLLNQMLATIDMTQVGVIAEALPSVVTDFPMVGTILGNIIGNANLTGVGNALNRYNAALGTIYQGCLYMYGQD